MIHRYIHNIHGEKKDRDAWWKSIHPSWMCRTSITDPCAHRCSPLAVCLGLILAETDDDVARCLRLAIEIVVDDGLRPVGVALLGIERRARVMRDHAVSTAERVLDRSQDVVARRRLDVPDIARVTFA